MWETKNSKISTWGELWCLLLKTKLAWLAHLSMPGENDCPPGNSPITKTHPLTGSPGNIPSKYKSCKIGLKSKFSNIYMTVIHCLARIVEFVLMAITVTPALVLLDSLERFVKQLMTYKLDFSSIISGLFIYYFYARKGPCITLHIYCVIETWTQ